MLKKKVCMLGAFAVGKTSLVQQFVKRMFSEKYLTTIGVRIDKKTVYTDSGELDLLIWDIHGEDNMQNITPAYLRGCSGYILVADGTRRETLDVVGDIDRRVRSLVGSLPVVVMVNKCDLEAEWEVSDEDVARLGAAGGFVIKTSAKKGLGVEEGFGELGRRIMSGASGEARLPQGETA